MNKEQVKTGESAWSAAPDDFMRCANSDCKAAEGCLRACVWREAQTHAVAVPTLNPRLATGGEQCPYYRSTKPVRMARGFKQLQSRMLPGEYEAFRQKCIARFGQNLYYCRRRGEKLLPPDEQDFILEAARSAGLTEDLSFDAYEESYDWR